MKELQLSERANGLGQVRCQNAHACRFLYFKVYVLPAGPISTSFYKCRPNELVDIVNMLAFFIFIFDLFVFCLFVCLFVCFCLKNLHCIQLCPCTDGHQYSLNDSKDSDYRDN